MCAQHQETCKSAGLTPCLPPLIMDSVLKGTAISDDDSMDSSIALNIQNPRENSGIIMTTLSIFLNLFLHCIS
jgi:hypothetical protein